MAFRFWKKDNPKKFKYDEVEVIDTMNKYLSNDIEALSPIIKSTIENINIVNKIKRIESPSSEQQEELKKAQDFLESRNIEPKKYLEELAKTDIFISQKISYFNTVKKSFDYKILKQLTIESAFASYQYQKQNNLYFYKFEDFFDDEDGHPFENLKKIVITNKTPIGEEINGICKDDILYLKDNMNFEEYTLSLIQTLTHELQHKISHNGTYEKHPVPIFVTQDINGLNEICTEWNAEQIISLFLDRDALLKDIEKGTYRSSKLEKDFFTGNSKNKNGVSFYTSAKDYREAVSFYESLDIIFKGTLKNLYYNRNLDFPYTVTKEIKKFKSDIYKFSMAAYENLYNNKSNNEVSYSNHILEEDKFNSMINSFTDLVRSYIRNGIGINKNTDFTSPEGESKLKELSKFFNSFESITFKRDGEELYEREIIKRNVLDSIFEKNEAKIQEVINLLDGKAKTVSATAVTTSTSISTKAVSSSVSVTTVNDELSFVPSFSEVKLKENSKEFDVNCSLSQLKQIFENYVRDNGFEKDRDGKYYKEDASVDDVKKLINHFFETREHFKGCIESVTIKDKDNTYVINDFSSVNNLDINIKQKSKEINVSKDLEL